MVTLSNQVKEGIVAFWDSLHIYPITNSRAYEKYIEMENALNSLSSAIYDRRCTYKDMGQKYLKSGACVFPFLNLFVYTDKQSKSKWYFSYVRNEQDDIFVLFMKYSSFVKDNIDNSNKRIITEDEIRAMVKRMIEEVLLNEPSYYKVISKNEKIKLSNGVLTTSLAAISDGHDRFDICEDDGCYVIYHGKRTKDAMYIFPELFNTLKSLPRLPLR